MGAAISSSLSMGLTYCCCTAAGNLCNACLGNTGEGATGRKRSVLLLTLAIAVALWFQYDVGPSIASKHGWMFSILNWMPGLDLHHSWTAGCESYAQDVALYRECAGNAGVYRPCLVASLFFALTALATKVNPNLNREAWPAKFGVFFFVVAGTVFVSNTPLFGGFYLFLARFGAIVFVLMQQVILIDIAYNWNEEWVERADQADRISYGSGSGWLKLIVGTCAAFYVLTIAGIIMLFSWFGGCSDNAWIISLTLFGVVALTAIQLSGSEGSLLTSSVMSLYTTYLAYSMVSKNPHGHCNPQLGESDVWGIVIGLTLTAISLAWTGWAWTAEDRLNYDGIQSTQTVSRGGPPSTSGAGQVNLDQPFLDPEDRPTAGHIVDSDGTPLASAGMEGSDVWKLNVVLVLISCFVAMTLTGFGAIEEIDQGGNAANPTAGRVNMTIIGLSQWTAIGLYIWTLLAPRVFPDRDFN